MLTLGSYLTTKILLMGKRWALLKDKTQQED